MSRAGPVVLIACIALAVAFIGCATPREEMYMLYGPMRAGDFSETTWQLDSMGIDYEVRNGNEIYISEVAAERIRAGYDRELSEMDAKVTVKNGEE